MCAYIAAHSTDINPWRCVVCDKISHHSEDGIMKHLTNDHELEVSRLKIDRKDGIYLYPEKEIR